MKLRPLQRDVVSRIASALTQSLTKRSIHSEQPHSPHYSAGLHLLCVYRIHHLRSHEHTSLLDESDIPRAFVWLKMGDNNMARCIIIYLEHGVRATGMSALAQFRTQALKRLDIQAIQCFLVHFEDFVVHGHLSSLLKGCFDERNCR